MHIFSVCLVGYGTVRYPVLSVFWSETHPRRWIILLLQIIFICFKTVLWIWIRILWVRSGSSISGESGSGSGPGYLWLKIEKKKIQWKIFSPLQFTCPLASLKVVQPKEKPSALWREHPAFLKIKFFYFCLVIFVLLDPDTDPVSTNLLYRDRFVPNQTE
jgi:hypothetical protein